MLPPSPTSSLSFLGDRVSLDYGQESQVSGPDRGPIPKPTIVITTGPRGAC